MDLQELKKAVQDFFGDTSRSQQDTLDGLESLSDDIYGYTESLKADIQSER